MMESPLKVSGSPGKFSLKPAFSLELALKISHWKPSRLEQLGKSIRGACYFGSDIDANALCKVIPHFTQLKFAIPGIYIGRDPNVLIAMTKMLWGSRKTLQFLTYCGSWKTIFDHFRSLLLGSCFDKLECA